VSAGIIPIERPAETPRAEGASLCPKAWLLIAATTASAAAAVLATRPELSTVSWVGLALLAMGVVVAERFQIGLYGESSVSVSFMFLLAGAMQDGAAAVVLLAPLMAVAGHRPDLPLNRLLFNGSVTMLGGLAAAATVALVGSLAHADAVLIASALLGSTVNYLVTAGLVAGVIALNDEQDIFAVWREKFQWLLPHYLVLGVFGFLLAFSYQRLGVPGFLVMLAPPLLVNYAMRQYVDRTSKVVLSLKSANSELQEANRHISEMSDELAEAYQETLRALVSALESRDHEIYGHSERVTIFSLAIAQRMGIDESSPFWHDLQHGAFLHDVGKIGVPDRILHKSSRLTDAEWNVMRGHAVKGYRMLSQVRFLRGAAEVAYCHHEHFDGRGYPRGLAGDEIPLTARVFAVADAFDAMTSRRPYQAARTIDEARAEVRRCNGAQFDPRVVDAFLAIDWSQLLEEMASADRAA